MSTDKLKDTTVRHYGPSYSAIGDIARQAEKEHKKDVSGKPEFVEVSPPLVSKELKKRWSHFIRKVYETDPLVSPEWTLDLPLQYPTKDRPFWRAFNCTRRNSIAH